MSLDEELKTNIKKRPKKSLFFKISINYLKQRTQKHNILKIMCYNNSVKDCKQIYNFPYKLLSCSRAYYIPMICSFNLSIKIIKNINTK